jgi:23S rRNA (adenine(2503)-C(2))-methyltransferase
MNLDNLYQVLKDEPKFRLQQAQVALWQNLVSDWSQVTTFPAALKAKLNEVCSLAIQAEVHVAKKENSTKALITLEDGAKIETVLLSHADGRQTVCVSSQVGCSLGCKFCATGTLGLTRDLTYNEILMQVLFFARILKKENSRVSNVVFMGMGEPFLNYDNVWKAVRYLNDKQALNIGARKISISTSGIIPGIEKLAKEKLQVNLAISLHAPNDKLRSELMRINKRFPLEKLLKAVEDYIKQTGRKVMFEYLMLKGVNDSLQHAEELSKLMAKHLYMVNLIPYNPTGAFKPSDRRSIDNFRRHLEQAGVEVSQRFTYGQDIDAACGQLANKASK